MIRAGATLAALAALLVATIGATGSGATFSSTTSNPSVSVSSGQYGYDVQAANGAGGTAGRFSLNDVLTLRWPAGTTAPVALGATTVNVAANGTMTFTTAGLGAITSNVSFVNNATSFPATVTRDVNVVQVTFGAVPSGGLRTTGVGQLSWTPPSLPTITELGAADQDF